MTLFADVDPFYAAASGAALIAIIVAALVLRDALLDLRAVKAAGIGNGRLRVVRTEVRFELHRLILVALVGSAALGATVLTIATPRAATWVAFVPRVAVLGAVVIIVVDAIATLRYRAWLRQAYNASLPRRDRVPGEEAEEAERSV